jgi:hypothetical protein
MRIERLPDDRLPRGDQSITSASSHPELLIREIAMRRRIHIPLAPGDRQMIRTWSRWMLAVYGLAAAGIVGYSMINSSSTTLAREAREKQARAEACEQRHAVPADAGTFRLPARCRTGRAIMAEPSSRQPQHN